MSTLTFTPAATADIDAIWDYTARTWGIDQADHYTDDIRDACIALAQGARQGRSVDIRAGYLKYAVGRHVIFFGQWNTDLVVVRILHQSMDTDRHL